MKIQVRGSSGGGRTFTDCHNMWLENKYEHTHNITESDRSGKTVSTLYSYKNKKLTKMAFLLA
jgi:hypothetical protein